MTSSRIYLTRHDYVTLRQIVQSSRKYHRAPIPQFLRFVRELNSAIVLEPEELPNDIITMHSRVGYSFGDTQKSQYAKIVFPAQTTEDKENISILSPLGLALIGEREGTELEYEAPGGTFHLKIRSVEHLHSKTVP